MSTTTYKDSGIEWLGKIPAHWGTKKLKFYGQIYSGATPKSDIATYYGGPIIWVTPADLVTGSTIIGSKKTITQEGLDSCGTTLVPKDSVIVSTRAPIGIVCVTGKALCTNQGCKALVIDKDAYYRYIYYNLLTQTDILNMLGRGTTFLELSTTDLANYKIPNPPRIEQQTISNYLDWECGRIDTIVEKQRQIIEKLKEYKKSVITEAVTKGLNPSAPMKDSGIEWIGQIPASWNVCRLKNYAMICNGADYKEHLAVDGRYPIVGSGGAFAKSDSFMYDKESVLLGRKGTVDKPLFIQEPFWTIDTMYYTQIKENCVPKFFFYLCTTINFDFYQYGTALPSMTQRDLSGIVFTCPPLPEQQAISDYLDQKCAEIDSAVTKREKMIELLNEYKKSLIYECVTGKKEVA